MRSWRFGIAILFTASCVRALAQESVEGLRSLPVGSGFYRGQAVEFRIWEGQALVEGDILLGPVKDLEQGREAVAIAGDRFRWPEGVIPFELDPNLPESSRITTAMEAWQKTTPVRFKPRQEERDYVLILRSSSNGTCSSNVGRIGGRQTVNLGDGCTTGNTIHELGHTIGLWHTQSRIDRNSHLRVLYENIDKAQWDQYNQQLLNGVDIGPFDYGSIMLYPITGFTRNTRNSMDTVPPGIPIGQRAALSAHDILAVRQMYGDASQAVTISTNPPGLPLLVDGELVETPRSFDWPEGEAHTIEAPPLHPDGGEHARLQFAKWSDGGARTREIAAAPGTHYIANYARWVQLRTNVSPKDAGRVEVSPASEDGFYPYGATLQIRAYPEGDYRFQRWISGAGGSTFLNANRQGTASNPVELTIRSATAFYQANFTKSAITTIASDPAGAQITVDGTTYYTPSAFVWTPGSHHSISISDRTNSPNSASRLVFREWSNGGERVQEITAGSGGVLTARLTLQHQVLARVASTRTPGTPNPNAARNLSFEPFAPDGYVDDGTELQVAAAGPDGAPFAHWYGDLGSDLNPQSLRVDEQTLVGANFVSPGLFSLQGLVNHASKQPAALAPGAVFTLYGTGIGPESPVESPEAVEDYAILVGGEPARLLNLEQNAITFQVPDLSAAAGTVTVELRTPQGTVRRTAGMLPASPGVYTVSNAGKGQLDAVNGDGSRNARESPVARGGIIRLHFTGIAPSVEAEQPDVEIRLGDLPAQILELRPDGVPGRYAATVQLPDGCPAGPEVPVVLWSQGLRSQFGTWVSVR